MDMHSSAAGRRCSRRDVLRGTLGAFGLAALGPIDRACAATALSLPAVANQKFLVVVELDGGNDTLNTVVPQGLANYTLRRPTIALGAGVTEALDTGPFATSQFRLNGRMTRLAQMYRDGEVAMVHRVGYPSANQSHDTSKLIWSSGQREGLFSANGWIARYTALAAPTPLGAVSLRRGRHRALTGGSSNPLTLDSLGAFRFDADTAFTNNHRLRLELVREMLQAQASSAPRDALLTGHQLADQIGAAVSGYTSGVTYATAGISQALRDVAMMLQAGFETRIFYTGFGGFDTHAGQGSLTGTHANLLGNLDEALKSFADDCKAMGIWQNCVVAVISEFGRRNFENGSSGTDHGGATCMLLTGGAVMGGQHGVAPTDQDLLQNVLPYAVDFRAVYAQILGEHLGLADPTRVFAEAFTSPVGVDVV
jgi:uncharacterized protein (DUF1501 family)